MLGAPIMIALAGRHAWTWDLVSSSRNGIGLIPRDDPLQSPNGTICSEGFEARSSTGNGFFVAMCGVPIISGVHEWELHIVYLDKFNDEHFGYSDALKFGVARLEAVQKRV